MSRKYAVIDLGTNTFHLLIAMKISTGQFKELYRKRLFIKLAENGIARIGEAPFSRAMKAMEAFNNTLLEYEVSVIKAFGTAALRTASNGPDFIQQVQQKTGIKIQLIPGDREATLIYKGVLQAVDFGENMGLVMDIGGGSVEFILADHQGLKWAQSFPIGLAVLFNNFHQLDPISREEIGILDQYLRKALAPLLEKLEQYQPKILIGASGTFDVLENMICQEKVSPFHSIVAVRDFHPLFDTLLKTNLKERLAMDDIPDTRAEMIIVALLLIQFILKQTKIHSISVSAYAMKEGMLQELMSES